MDGYTRRCVAVGVLAALGTAWFYGWRAYRDWQIRDPHVAVTGSATLHVMEPADWTTVDRALRSSRPATIGVDVHDPNSPGMAVVLVTVHLTAGPHPADCGWEILPTHPQLATLPAWPILNTAPPLIPGSGGGPAESRFAASYPELVAHDPLAMPGQPQPEQLEVSTRDLAAGDIRFLMQAPVRDVVEQGLGSVQIWAAPVCGDRNSGFTPLTTTVVSQVMP